MAAYNPYAYMGPYTGAYGGYGQGYGLPAQPQLQAQQQPQIQDGGLVRVRSVSEAQNWPVAPGNSVTFKVEDSPYICTKTMGFSQLEQPRFEKFRLVKEEDEGGGNAAEPRPEYALKEYAEGLERRIAALESRGTEDDGSV